MRDVYDYLSRLGVALLLCPVAATCWFIFALAGFDIDGFMAYLGTLSQEYAAMGEDEQAILRFQVYAVWGVLAFGFMFLSFVLSPPRFSYRLTNDHGHWHIDVVDTRC